MEEENDLFSLCIKDGKLKIGDRYQEQVCSQSYRTILIQRLVLLSYRLVNYTVWKFRPLIMKIFKTECLLNSKLPNTHACLSAVQDFCPNPLLWVVISEKTCNNFIFNCVAGIWPYISPTKCYRKQ